MNFSWGECPRSQNKIPTLAKIMLRSCEGKLWSSMIPSTFLYQCKLTWISQVDNLMLAAINIDFVGNNSYCKFLAKFSWLLLLQIKYVQRKMNFIWIFMIFSRFAGVFLDLKKKINQTKFKSLSQVTLCEVNQ